MTKDNISTVLPMRVMRPGMPARDTMGRILVRHAVHGFMIGEMVPMNNLMTLIAIGIDTTPARNPVAVAFTTPEAREQCLEWSPLVTSDNPADRARAKQ